MISTVVVNTTWSYYLELHERSQARNMLNKIRTCVINTKEGDTIDKLESCASGVKTTPTGDVFAYSLKTKRFLYDPSFDCHTEYNRYMTTESECTLHSDKEACAKAIAIMNKGMDSYRGQNVSWRFDDSRELLEWIVFPDESHTLDGELRNNSLKGSDQIIIAIGIQEDELFKEFFVFEIVLLSQSFIAIILVLLYGVYYRRFNDRTAP